MGGSGTDKNNKKPSTGGAAGGGGGGNGGGGRSSRRWKNPFRRSRSYNNKMDDDGVVKGGNNNNVDGNNNLTDSPPGRKKGDPPRVVNLKQPGSPSGQISAVSSATGFTDHDANIVQPVKMRPLLPSMSDESTTMDVVFEDSERSGSGRFLFTGGTGAGVGGATTRRQGRSIMVSDDLGKGNNNKLSGHGSSFLSRSTSFRKISDWAFEVVDTDQSGCVDQKELYSGLLLIHLKLATYAGPAACKPVSRQYVNDIFIKMDTDKSGSLDRDEFREVMMVLCSNVLTRVTIQWAMTLLIVPLIAQFVLEKLIDLGGFVWSCWLSMDEFETAREVMGQMMKHIKEGVDMVMDMVLSHVPPLIQNYVQNGYTKVCNVIDMIPDSVWKTIPLTVLTCILGCIAIPYMIFKLDDYFQVVADHKQQQGGGGTTTTKST